MGVASVWLTAAAVTSPEIENSKARSMRFTTSDGYEHDSCSNGANAVNCNEPGSVLGMTTYLGYGITAVKLK